MDAERALGEIGALQGLRAGQVRLATSDAFANELVPRLCVDFQRQHQGVWFEVTVLPTPQVPEAVRQGTADIVYASRKAFGANPGAASARVRNCPWS